MRLDGQSRGPKFFSARLKNLEKILKIHVVLCVLTYDQLTTKSIFNYY